MDYEDMIDENAAPKEAIEPNDDLDVIAETTEPKRMPWKAVILTGLLASLIGAGGGGYGVYAGLKAQISNTSPDMAALTAPLNAKIERLETRLDKAELQARVAGNRPVLKTAPVDLSSIESRLDDLETREPSEIDPDAITALQAAQADGFEWPDVTALETRLTGLEVELSSLPDMPESSELSDVMERLETLETDFLSSNIGDKLSTMDAKAREVIETRLEALENRGPVSPKVERITVLAFPKAALLSAIEDNTEGSFMKKALSKHVRVKDGDNPRTLIDGIESDIAEGRLDAAANKFERLPEPVQAAGRAWYESVKASL